MRTPLGALLRGHRVRLGLTQEAVEAKTGIGQAHISAIEVGRRGASRDVIRSLADCYGLDDAQRGQLLDAPVGAPSQPTGEASAPA